MNSRGANRNRNFFVATFFCNLVQFLAFQKEDTLVGSKGPALDRKLHTKSPIGFVVKLDQRFVALESLGTPNARRSTNLYIAFNHQAAIFGQRR